MLNNTRMTIHSLLPQMVAPPLVPAFNRLFGADRYLNFSLAQSDYTLRFIPAVGIPSALIKTCLLVDDQMHFFISLETRFINSVLSEYADMPALQKLPSELREIAIEIAFEQLLDQLAEAGHCSTTLIAVPLEIAPEEESCHLAFKFERKDDQTNFSGAIRTSNQAMAWLLEKLMQMPTMPTEAMDHIPLALYFHIGHTTFTADDFIQVARNDIIMLDSDLSAVRQTVTIRVAPGFSLNGRIDTTHRIVVESKLETDMENKMAESVATADGDAPEPEAPEPLRDATKIDEIPILMEFQVGQAQISFAELSRLQPGYIFEPGVDLEKPVTIKANGKAIGLGQLVTIGDRVGVRVLQFNPSNPTK